MSEYRVASRESESYALFASAVEWHIAEELDRASDLYRLALHVDRENAAAIFNLAGIDARRPDNLKRAERRYLDCLTVIERKAKRETPHTVEAPVALGEFKFSSLWHSAKYALVATQLNRRATAPEAEDAPNPKGIGAGARELLKDALEVILELMAKLSTGPNGDEKSEAVRKQRKDLLEFLTTELEPAAAVLLAASLPPLDAAVGKDEEAPSREELLKMFAGGATPPPKKLIAYATGLDSERSEVSHWFNYDVACYYATCGLEADAITQLRRCLEKVVGGERQDILDWAPQDKSLKRIHGKEAFEELLEEYADPLVPKRPRSELSELFFAGEHSKKLHKAGIKDADALLTRADTPKERETLAKEIGVTPRVLKRWALIADLMRIPAIGPRRARLLSYAGIESLGELARARAADLEEDLRSEAIAHGLKGPVPDEETLSAWISSAEDMKPLVK